jgi:hypothetical protein
VIDLITGQVRTTISVSPPGRHSLLDDIALTADRRALYGADFGRGEIVLIPLDGSAPSVLVSGLNAPTSVLTGRGATFNATSLYVTEAGGLLDDDLDQRVIEIPL